ncbi:MAG: hypothetical protein MJ246_06260 [Clostridia bacterium]|nr:hypothetical protein [Clostridia bacterium]
MDSKLIFDLTTEILYSYIYEEDMSYEKLDSKYRLYAGTSEAILKMCNIFRDCGFKLMPGKRNIPMVSIYKLARVNEEDIEEYLHDFEVEIDKAYIEKTIAADKYSRDIKDAFVKTALDSRLEEIEAAKYELKLAYLKSNIQDALHIS